MRSLVSENEWSMNSLIGWVDPCLKLVQHDMNEFIVTTPYISYSIDNKLRSTICNH